MPEYPPEVYAAIDAALDALPQPARRTERDRWRIVSRIVLEAAGPVLADKIASAILRYADENEPLAGSGTYLAWHRHFEAASSVAAKAFGRDNLEARSDPQ